MEIFLDGPAEETLGKGKEDKEKKQRLRDICNSISLK